MLAYAFKIPQTVQEAASPRVVPAPVIGTGWRLDPAQGASVRASDTNRHRHGRVMPPPVTPAMRLPARAR